MTIIGNNFSDTREQNRVRVGGQYAYVVEASSDRLLVITHPDTVTGPVEVEVDSKIALGSRPFEELPWPKPQSGKDGPPYSYAGRGAGGAAAGSVPSTGTARILVVACYPTDKVPANLTTVRQEIVDTFADVTTFYDQASYGQLTVQVDVTTFVPLLQDSSYYHRSNGAVGYPNIDGAVLDQLMAECAQGAVDQTLDLDDYVVMVAAVHMPGLSVRAWGGWSSSNFAYDDGAGTSISITTSNPLGLIAQSHTADWGRAAHEFAHNMLDGGLVLGEDVYSSDLVDSSEATAAPFAMMGNHDSHPLFSAFNIVQLGWYDSVNVVRRDWDRNPFSEEFDIVAHALAQDTSASRVHIVEIRITGGLSYFIEVRQRPDTSAASPSVFDENIPLGMGSDDGGVIVTKVVTDTLNNNHQTRLITLLQEPQRLLGTGESAEDPLRTIRISVVDDSVQARPRVCRVRVEWAQDIADTPDGDFDLRIEPWGPGWETEDIWVDRNPFGSYDFTDPSGNPTGNGDEPRPMEINRFYARVHNDGTETANSVKVTHYAITPPGVGDNGNWTPLSTYTIASIPNNGSSENFTNWVPTVGEHTCLKVAIHTQLGEVSGGNNQAQENVFNFQPAASSIAEPVKLTVAVRNPLDERALVLIALENVPRGYYVYFPHRWLWLDALAEKRLDMLIIPLFDPKQPYVTHFNDKQDDRRAAPVASIRLYGRVPRVYSEKLEITGEPASWMAPIGGVLARVEPKLRGEINLDPNIKEDDGICIVRGCLDPKIRCQALRVDMIHPNGEVTSVLTDTDERGCFIARFKCPDIGECKEIETSKPKRIISQTKPATLTVDQRTNCSPKKDDSDNQPPIVDSICVTSFQAHIFNAGQIAPTSSNIVHREIKKK
jgi:M6 family metalloprotease-like protein